MEIATQPRRAGPIASLIFGALFIVAGYFAGFHFGKPILDQAKQSANWPTVEGKIESSEVTQRHDDKGTSYSADICYSYPVKDRTYKSSRIWYGGGFSSSSSGEFYRLVDRYPKGKVVAVHYDPEHPEEAVLEAGAFFTSYILYVVGWVFLVIGVLVLLSVPRALLRSLSGA
jgi:hypothetical protein